MPYTVLVGAAGQLALGLLLARRARAGHPVAFPLSLLCLVLGGWNLANWAQAATHDPAWRVLEVTISPWLPPLAYHTTLRFVGARHRRRRSLHAAYLGFGLLSASSAAGAWWAWGVAWVDSDVWSCAYLGPFLGILAACVALLARHVRGAPDEDERMRALLMLVGIALGGALGTTELLDDLVGLPNMGALGSLVTTAIFAAVTLRLRLFGHEVSTSMALYALGLGTLALVLFLAVFRLLGHDTALLVLACLLVTGVLAASMAPVLARTRLRRERERRWVGLGRLAEQMAHDLKNPLAALQASIQFLAHERDRGRSVDPHAEVFDRLAHQVQRLTGVIDRYHRLGGVKPRPREVDVQQVVEAAWAARATAAAPGIALRREFAEGLPRLHADADLLAGALDNLMQNAVEAMPMGGALTLRTGHDGADWAWIEVEDEGAGMDARRQEQVLEGFLSTKPGGSGLGLAFVQRVVQAHAGRMVLESQPGRGTRVRLLLPVRRGGGHGGPERSARG